MLKKFKNYLSYNKKKCLSIQANGLALIIFKIMLFFRRRDTNQSHSQLSDNERCVHASLFFAFIFLTITIVLFYFAGNNKNSNERTFYFIGAGVSLLILLFLVVCAIIYIRRLCYQSPSIHRHTATAYKVSTEHIGDVPPSHTNSRPIHLYNKR
ncbi:unnamed protein product [Didymodactylos carnosus]|uniref:Uncharacterized protein n=1 Tax=Didymodactylos carnosus TaxID=1234261 RepID=A0A814BJ45_9BILA|nr:unnamed protein product [Didymodactylos carnosus]CAF3706037.1 unnamed protein product [Didymodactylos carnosus]